MFGNLNLKLFTAERVVMHKYSPKQGVRTVNGSLHIKAEDKCNSLALAHRKPLWSSDHSLAG